MSAAATAGASAGGTDWPWSCKRANQHTSQCRRALQSRGTGRGCKRKSSATRTCSSATSARRAARGGSAPGAARCVASALRSGADSADATGGAAEDGSVATRRSSNSSSAHASASSAVRRLASGGGAAVEAEAGDSVQHSSATSAPKASPLSSALHAVAPPAAATRDSAATSKSARAGCVSTAEKKTKSSSSARVQNHGAHAGSNESRVTAHTWWRGQAARGGVAQRPQRVTPCGGARCDTRRSARARHARRGWRDAPAAHRGHRSSAHASRSAATSL